MSLFRVVDWVSHLIPNASAIVTSPFFEDREQLVVGCEDGQISVIDAGDKQYQSSILFTYQSDHPVLQMETGEFLPSMRNILAVLSPSKLDFYKLNFEKTDESSVSFEKLFSHAMSISAWNMCKVLTETSLQLIVQTIDCKISLFQGDQCVFEHCALRALHPGPILYSSPSSSLITANNGFLNSVKFSLLSSGSQKRINYDWFFNLGDTALQLEVFESNQPSILVLCRRHVTCLSTGGSIQWQIRFEAVATAMCVYTSYVINDPLNIRFIVATSDDNLLIYNEQKLVWNCHAHMTPVALKVSSYNKIYENVLTMLSADGKLLIGYLGTQPNLYKVPTDTKIVNFAEKMEQLKGLEKKIKENESSGGGGLGKKDGIGLSLTFGEKGKRTIEHNARNNVPYCTLQLEFANLGDITKLHINIMSELETPSKQIVLNVPANPSVVKSIKMPLDTLFGEAPVDRNAKFKLTIDTDAPVVPLNQLFKEFESENPQAIGFLVHGCDAANVSIFAASKSNRYRVQSEHVGLLEVAFDELISRIQSAVENVQIGANIPFEYISEIVEFIQEAEKTKSVEQTTIDSRMKEVRAIEALSLNNCKSGNLDTVSCLDALFEKSYRELLEHMDRYTERKLGIEANYANLASLFQLASEISKISRVETIINGNFYRNTQQSLRDRLMWSARNEKGTEIRLIEKLCEHSNKELPKIREEDEEGDEASAATN
ncbi:unnamed protein product [Caenorhabditis bovis]|uniref:Protein PTHB1 n=1 Tax=Caenorhabditis bovis TaxID=2654633 RepID=A0A8S1FBP9_9PELO|nr:unnamed protein product [Caenorhabditis bovis]